MLELLKEEKAQTSIEYLLILGGAVAAAAMVGMYLKTSTRTIGEQVSEEAS